MFKTTLIAAAALSMLALGAPTAKADYVISVGYGHGYHHSYNDDYDYSDYGYSDYGYSDYGYSDCDSGCY